MFYFLLQPILMYNWTLILAAVIPAIFLMIKVYKSDRLEKENSGLLKNLVIAGILSTFLALVEERLGSLILGNIVEEGSVLYNVLLYFIVVGVSEETSKYIFMKKRTWDSPEFDCQYDGLVYAVFTSLGFALWENINYVLHYGFTTAIVRAVTAIPGHACFGVYMGIFYGIAKKYDNMGNRAASKFFRVLALIVPILFHGAYDYIASMEESGSEGGFLIFVIALFVLSFALVNKASRNDKYID